MSGQLLLINPRKRRASGKRRTAAQRAATARLVAFNKAKRHGGRKRNPVVARRAKRRASYAANPAKRRVHHVRRRRNPSSLGSSLRLTAGGITAVAKNAALAAGGAVAVDYAYGYVRGYLPVSMQTPADASGAVNPLYFAGKGLFAVALGVVAGKYLRMGSKAAAMANGSVIVTAYSLLRGLLPASIAGQLGYYAPAQTDTPNLPGALNQPGRTVNGSITDMRAYLSAQGSNAARGSNRAYDNPGMSAYLSRG